MPGTNTKAPNWLEHILEERMAKAFSDSVRAGRGAYLAGPMVTQALAVPISFGARSLAGTGDMSAASFFSVPVKRVSIPVPAQHRPQFVLHTQQRAKHIRVERRRVALGSLLRHRAGRALGPCVIDRHIQASETANRLIHEFAHILIIPNVPSTCCKSGTGTSTAALRTLLRHDPRIPSWTSIASAAESCAR